MTFRLVGTQRFLFRFYSYHSPKVLVMDSDLAVSEAVKFRRAWGDVGLEVGFVHGVTAWAFMGQIGL